MPVRFNHTIVFAHDKMVSARFLTELLGLPEPRASGIFAVVALADGASLDYAEPGGTFSRQHIAFLVGEDDFDGIHERIRRDAVPHWADPFRTVPGQVNTIGGGRGVYFEDPGGHLFEVMTQPGP